MLYLPLTNENEKTHIYIYTHAYIYIHIHIYIVYIYIYTHLYIHIPQQLVYILCFLPLLQVIAMCHRCPQESPPEWLSHFVSGEAFEISYKCTFIAGKIIYKWMIFPLPYMFYCQNGGGFPCSWRVQPQPDTIW